ncbi:lipopolysaccharide biosynthesis protein [Cohnella silvisoli]|uniref:Oligosaccharide flippase family protein n=1 Tax=Cohnella silvisoli TaxID=2873699 RepID=A0ABV1KXB4_9BACL|nr:oligosaccharide flippase family protein [Cohnella silvisoli]MCD9024066.1 oligosaccharide flippase family protein [Cohnella silvisoli]
MAQLAIHKAWKGNGLVQTIVRTSATNLLVMVISTLTSIVTARMFGVIGKGEFSAILFWPTLLAGLVGFGLPTSLIYNMKQNKGGGGDFVRTGFLFQIPVSIIVGIVAWVWLPVWLGNYSADVIQITRWFTVLMLPIILAVNLISALAQSTGNFKVYNGVRLFVPLCNLAGLVALWAVGNLSLHFAALVFLVTSALVMTWSLYSIGDVIRMDWFKGLGNLAAARALFGYGSKVFGVELLGTLYAQFDKIIILSMLTAKDLGLYTVVYALSRVFNVVQMAITNVIFPKVTGMDKEQIIATVGRAFRLSLILMTIVVIPSLFIGRFLLGLLFGEPFLAASNAFYLLSFECILGGGSWILASSFNAMGRPGLVLVRQLIALAATIGLFFVFTPLYGLNGIALALLIGAVIRLIVTMASMRITFNVRMRGMLFDKNDFRFLMERLKERKQRKGER